ncbi:hypothetical protein DL95DRAFT_469157 [Leptodontidium sp. 2 PMI_412]|nr:hypothetical protein DL95DRAFT_469157 [Leptodontidium sp. 2 PMI_412]
MTDKFSSAEVVFATTAKRFYEELSNENKLNFQEIENAEDMVASIERNIVQLNSRTSRLLDACKKVDNFRQSMDPFFRIVDIFVSTRLLGNVAIIWDLSWTPFDDWFSEILGRLKRHQQDFDSGLKNVYSEELIMHFNAMDLERVKNSEQRDVLSEQREAAKKRSIDEKIKKLQKWIASPNWTGPYEAAKEKRLADTGLWILQRPEYSSWLEQEVPYPARGSVFVKNVLVVTAKLGFGNTILSTRIIEDLRRRSRLCGQSWGQNPATTLAYFYFDQQQADRYSHESQGQICGSAQSLEILIRIYLEQLNGSFLVFDGLDECPEWAEFLVTLRKCAEETSCKIVFITRPHLLLDAIIGPKAFRMDLKLNENMNEMHAILRPELADLLQRGKLGPKYGPHDTENLVKSLAERANSIVLWAALMMKYLQSPYLSSTERVEIIEEVKSFQGLHGLVGAILLDIGKRVPKSQHEKIRRVFLSLVSSRTTPLDPPFD